MSDPNQIFVYSPEGEPFETSKANARDLTSHAGWTYGPPAPAAPAETPPPPPPPAKEETPPPPPPPPPAPEPKQEEKPAEKPAAKPAVTIEEVEAPAKAAKKADAAE